MKFWEIFVSDLWICILFSGQLSGNAPAMCSATCSVARTAFVFPCWYPSLAPTSVPTHLPLPPLFPKPIITLFLIPCAPLTPPQVSPHFLHFAHPTPLWPSCKFCWQLVCIALHIIISDDEYQLSQISLLVKVQTSLDGVSLMTVMCCWNDLFVSVVAATTVQLCRPCQLQDACGKSSVCVCFCFNFCM